MFYYNLLYTAFITGGNKIETNQQQKKQQKIE